MVVNMKKWSRWQQPPAQPSAATAATKFRVKLERIKLEGFEHGGGGGVKVMAVNVTWKGERKHGLAAVGFHRRRRDQQRWCKERIVKKGEIIVWEEEEDLENICCFSTASSNGDGFDLQKFVPWDVSFKIAYGEYNKGKMAVIGKASLNLAEFASNTESSVIEKKLPVNLEVAGMTTQATISVLLSFVEVRDSVSQLALNSTQLEGFGEGKKERKKQLSLEEVSLSDSDNSVDSVTFDSESRVTTESSSSGTSQRDADKKAEFFHWKRQRLSARPAKTKAEDSQLACDSVGSDPIQVSIGAEPSEPAMWEVREFVSRDGESELKTDTFFASFDQRSDKAAGPSACTALVTVIAHWLQSNNSVTMPTGEEFDRLIVDGSSEWQNLCKNGTYVEQFPDKHFDLETVLRAGIRPLSVSREKSFVGFFGAEKFECLNGAMSFDDIWDHEIRRSRGTYIVSWNDHFFVLHAADDAYYIIDTLGERLFEGCNQAYILRFDDGSRLQQVKTGDGKGTDEVVCSGKECCKEFIKRFLASIPVKELEMAEQKQAVSYYDLHHRLQIEFNFCSSS